MSRVTGCFSWLCGGRPKENPTKPIKGSQQAVPTAGEYAFEVSKQTIEVLQGFVGLIPLPCVDVVLKASLLLLTTYEVHLRLQHMLDVVYHD